MTRFVLAVILAVASTFVGSNVAAAASKPSLAENETRVSSGSGPGMDFSEFRQANAENSSHLDPRPLPQLSELAQVFVPMSWACYTPVGACRMGVPAPIGSSCYCVFPGGTFWGTVE